MKDLASELRKFSTIVEQSPVLIFTTDLQGHIEYVNPFFTQVTGYTAEEILGRNPRILKSGKQPPEFYKDLWSTIAAGKIWRGSFCNRTKNGKEFWAAATISPVLNENGEPMFYVSVGEDVTQKKQQSDVIEHMATHDGLTGLLNRVSWMEHLRQAIEEVKRDHSQMAVMYIDADCFKEINDGYGHESGDEVLKEIAARLTSNIRTVDAVARLGGDEFVILLKNVQSKDKAVEVAKRILGAFELPVKFSMRDEIKEKKISLSIGMSFYTDHLMQAADLLKQADVAMYEAKKTGKNKFYLAD